MVLTGYATGLEGFVALIAFLSLSSFAIFLLMVCFHSNFPVNRRLLLDDSRGVAETLNETVCVLDDCRGLVVRILCHFYSPVVVSNKNTYIHT